MEWDVRVPRGREERGVEDEVGRSSGAGRTAHCECSVFFFLLRFLSRAICKHFVEIFLSTTTPTSRSTAITVWDLLAVVPDTHQHEKNEPTFPACAC